MFQTKILGWMNDLVCNILHFYYIYQLSLQLIFFYANVPLCLRIYKDV